MKKQNKPKVKIEKNKTQSKELIKWERWEKINRVLTTIFWVLFLVGIIALFTGVLKALGDPSQVKNQLFIIGVSLVVIQQLIRWFWKGANEIIEVWTRDSFQRRL